MMRDVLIMYVTGLGLGTVLGGMVAAVASLKNIVSASLFDDGE